MAKSMPTVYDYQVAVCKAFFVEQLPRDGIKPLNEEEIPLSLKQFKGSVFDITGFDAHHVVGVLSYIVNARDEFKKNKTFYLLIKGKHKNVEFKLALRPTEQQPGNGIVSLRPKSSGTKYEELNDMLQASYYTDTSSFAKDIKRVFKNNVHIGGETEFPRATTEVYMIWLFEIARRLVRSEKPSTQQMDFDGLPIGSAIAGLVKLLVLGDGEKCNFNDVFLPKETFHCFTGKPGERKKAINRINDALGATIENPSAKCYAQELEQLFCSEAELTATFENLRIQEDSVKSEVESK